MGVSVAVTQTTCNTSTGNQSITISGFGTPKAAIIEVIQATTLGTLAAGAGGSYGACTGASNRWSVAFRSEDNVSTSDQYTLFQNDEVVSLVDDAGSLEAEADFNAWVTDGIQINWATAPGTAYLMIVTLFGGTDLSAHADVEQMSNSASTAHDVTNPGFEPDVVFTSLTRFGPGTISANTYHCRGFVHNDGAGGITQYSAAHNWRDNRTTTQSFLYLEDRGGAVQLLASGNLDWYAVFSAFDSSGFTITETNNGANNQYVCYLALAFDGVVDSAVFYDDTATSTGNDASTAPGIEPQFVSLIPTIATAFQTTYSNSTAGSFGQAYFTEDDEYASSYTDEDNASTTNTSSGAENASMFLHGHTQLIVAEATFVSMDASGYTINYSTAPGTARRHIGIAIGAEAGGGGATVPIMAHNYRQRRLF